MSDKIIAVKKESVVEDLKIFNNHEEPLTTNQAHLHTSLCKRKRGYSLEKEESLLAKKPNTVKPDSNATPSAEPDNDKPIVIPMNRDSYFYCRRCNENIKGCKEYYGHLKSAHNIRPNINRVRYIDLQPDIDDPQFYCRSCERPHTDKTSYYSHLKRVHHMLLKPFDKPKKTEVLPDPKDPNNYCRVCKKAYSKSSFKRHLFLSHKMDTKFADN